jgi:hypothetical protein
MSRVGIKEKITNVGSGLVNIGLQLFQDSVSIEIITSYLVIAHFDLVHNGKSVQTCEGEQE